LTCKLLLVARLFVDALMLQLKPALLLEATRKMEVPDKLLLATPQATTSYSHLLRLTAHLQASSDPEALDARK
jgi:hypothetical protein